jgi:hypothetical protein
MGLNGAFQNHSTRAVQALLVMFLGKLASSLRSRLNRYIKINCPSHPFQRFLTSDFTMLGRPGFEGGHPHLAPVVAKTDANLLDRRAFDHHLM